MNFAILKDGSLCFIGKLLGCSHSGFNFRLGRSIGSVFGNSCSLVRKLGRLGGKFSIDSHHLIVENIIIVRIFGITGIDLFIGGVETVLLVITELCYKKSLSDKLLDSLFGGKFTERSLVICSEAHFCFLGSISHGLCIILILLGDVSGITFSCNLCIKSDGLLDTVYGFLLEILSESKHIIIHLIFNGINIHSVIRKNGTVVVDVCVLYHIVVIVILNTADLPAADGADSFIHRKIFPDGE